MKTIVLYTFIRLQKFEATYENEMVKRCVLIGKIKVSVQQFPWPLYALNSRCFEIKRKYLCAQREKKVHACTL